jgi:hypothetical protein
MVIYPFGLVSNGMESIEPSDCHHSGCVIGKVKPHQRDALSVWGLYCTRGYLWMFLKEPATQTRDAKQLQTRLKVPWSWYHGYGEKTTRSKFMESNVV